MDSQKKHVCSQCKRRFSTKAAVAQHRRDAHSAGSQPRRPVPSRARGPRSGPQTYVESGRDLLGTITLSQATPAGQMVFQQVLNPRLMAHSRVHQVAALWSRWKPKRLNVTLVAGGSYAMTGTFLVGWNADATVAIVPGRAHEQVATYRPSVTMRVNETKSLSIPMEMSRKWYHTAGAAEESSHGSIVAAASSTISGMTGSFQVQVMLDWAMEFEGPEFAAEADGGLDDITCDDGWYHLFTTSDSSFDSARLTFKMTAGGSMVPFSASRPGYVYQPVGTVQYYDEAGTLRNCNWFSQVQDYGTSGLVLHASKEDAVDYVKTGNKEKILPFKKEGPWVKPDYPHFKGKPAALWETRVESVVSPIEARLAELEAKLSQLERGSMSVASRAAGPDFTKPGTRLGKT